MRAPAALLQCEQAFVRQCRRSSTMSVKRARENITKQHTDIFKKLPSLFNDRVPRQDLFTNRGAKDGRYVYGDPRASFRMLSRPAVEPSDQPRAVFSFQGMGVHPQVLTALQEMEVFVPSVIQQTAIPLALKGRTVMLCAPTGSGKTLAFLAPMFHAMLQDKARGIELRPNRPRALVVAPSFELVHQIWGVASRLGRATGLTVREHYGAQSRADMMQEVSTTPFDVMVTTPEGLRRMRDKAWVVESDVKYVAYDEADLTIGGSFHQWARVADTETFFDTLKPLLMKQFERDSYLGRHKVQFFLSSSCVTANYEKRVNAWFPHLQRVVHEDVHVAPGSLIHRFYPVKRQEKQDYLRGILAKLGLFPDRDHMQKVEMSKKNFWFPDAVTFEQGLHHPLEDASHVRAAVPGTAELLPAPYKHLIGASRRPAYLKEYSSEQDRKPALPAPGLLYLEEKGREAAGEVEGDEEASTALLPAAEATSALVVCESALSVIKGKGEGLLRPESIPREKVQWGSLTTYSAPFTGLPGLLPQRNPAKGARVIIFVDTAREGKRLARYLADLGYRVASFSSMTGVCNHAARINQFESWASGESAILISTDLASRGLDHYVEAVINYSIPTYASDYICRAGRAGRMGRIGVVHTFVTKNNSTERCYARQLEHRLAKHKPLHHLAANAEALRKPLKQWWKKRVERLNRKWTIAQWRGFVTKHEETKLRKQTLGKIFRGMPNPKDPLGAATNTERKIKHKVLMKKNEHLSWQYQMTTSGTGILGLRHARPAKLMHMGPTRVRHLGKSQNDLRTSFLWKPLNKDKQKDMKQKYGRYAVPRLLDLRTNQKGVPLYNTKVNYPSFFHS